MLPQAETCPSTAHTASSSTSVTTSVLAISPEPVEESHSAEPMNPAARTMTMSHWLREKFTQSTITAWSTFTDALFG